ncbi:MAG: V-type ATPase 116kDa subunit family protein [Porphyromonas sp.]|nr:V-type ATPase 116kDa subunit family protein [Porphyromonas sp.]
MIEPMKKYSYFLFEPEYHNFLVLARDLGVIHVKERTSTKEVARFQQNSIDQSEVNALLTRLARLRSNHKLEEDQDPDTLPHTELSGGLPSNYSDYLQTITELDEKVAAEERALSAVKADLQELEPWGDFDPALITKLEQSGQHLHFWKIPKQQYNPEWEESQSAVPINDEGRFLYFVTLDTNKVPTGLPNADLLKLPTRSKSMLEVEQTTIEGRLQALHETLVYLAYHPHPAEEELIRLENEFNFEYANFQGDRLFEDKLVILEGWVPESQASSMELALSQAGYAYVELDFVEDQEQPPIKLTNSRFARVFQPLVEMFSLPNYYEIDPTPLVAPFFLLFFGICFGDAGYGLLLLLASTFMKPKAKESTKPLLELGQWLGLSGFVIGFFSGSFFGIELVKVEWLAAIREYFISSENMMVISVAIGFIHVIFGKYVAAYKKQKQKGLRHALSEYAWPTVILLAGLMFILPMAQITIPKWVEYVLYGVVGLSVLLILFYNSPGKNIFLNVGIALWETYNNASGLIGDVLSYIRLFAIGLTGAVLGQVFNNLAMMVTSDLNIFIAIPIGAIILLLGHGINFGLTTIGALVHPIRLIYVEYFNNSAYEGGGEAYNPLRELKTETE